MELHQSPGIHACFELRMDVSKYAQFEVRNITIVHELWLTLHCIASLVSCWLESNYSLSTPNRQAWVPPHWQNERKNSRAGWLPKPSLILPFALSRSMRPNEVKTVCFTYLLHSILVSAIGQARSVAWFVRPRFKFPFGSFKPLFSGLQIIYLSDFHSIYASLKF